MAHWRETFELNKLLSLSAAEACFVCYWCSCYCYEGHCVEASIIWVAWQA